MKSLLERASNGWIVSGSCIGYGDFIQPGLTHAVCLWVPREEREKRLLDRERKKFGRERIKAGGDMAQIHQNFMNWARRFDTAGHEQSSRKSVDLWLSRASCPIIRLSGDQSLEDSLRIVCSELASK